MARGHSGAEEDSVSEDISCVVRQLVTCLLCRCLITDLYQVIVGRKCLSNAAVGPTTVVSNYLRTVTIPLLVEETPTNLAETKPLSQLSESADLFCLTLGLFS